MEAGKVKFWLHFLMVVIAIILFVLLSVVMVQFFNIKNLKKIEAAKKKQLNQILEAEEYYDSANKYVESEKFLEEYARNYLGQGKEGDSQYN